VYTYAELKQMVIEREEQESREPVVISRCSHKWYDPFHKTLTFKQMDLDRGNKNPPSEQKAPTYMLSESAMRRTYVQAREALKQATWVKQYHDAAQKAGVVAPEEGYDARVGKALEELLQELQTFVDLCPPKAEPVSPEPTPPEAAAPTSPLKRKRRKK
jgi:hypothetical protein